MNWADSKLIDVFLYLLPGFVAAGVFYSLTAHRKTSPFERVIQALIFTIVIQATMIVIRECLYLLGYIVSFGIWTADAALVLSVVMAGVFGVLLSRSINRDSIHGYLRRKGLTSRTSYPSEWYSAFTLETRWVILHLKGGRRLYGWPQEWPDHPDVGHFVIDQPEWLLDDNKRMPLVNVSTILVSADEVEMVEFLRNNDEVEANQSDTQDTDDRNEALTNKEHNHGNQSPTTSTESAGEVESGPDE